MTLFCTKPAVVIDKPSRLYALVDIMTNNYLVATTSLLQDAPTDTAESEGGGDVGVRLDRVSVVHQRTPVSWCSSNARY